MEILLLLIFMVLLGIGSQRDSEFVPKLISAILGAVLGFIVLMCTLIVIVFSLGFVAGWMTFKEFIELVVIPLTIIAVWFLVNFLVDFYNQRKGESD